MSTEHIRRLNGVGTVYHGDTVLKTDVKYLVDIYREVQEGSTHSGPFKVPGMFRVVGQIEDALPLGQQFKLATGNGYSIEFFVKDSLGSIAVSGPIVDASGKPIY